MTLRYVKADLGLEGNPGGVYPPAQAEFSAGKRGLPAAAGDVRGEQLVEGTCLWGCERAFCALESVTGRRLRLDVLTDSFRAAGSAQ